MVLSPGAGRASAAGACFLCRLPTLPLACFPAPYPPDPLPRRGRGRPRLFHARGFAPCIPGAEPGRHRSRGRIARWRELAFFVACLPTLPLVYFSASYPPSPRSQSALPRRGRGRLKVYFAGGSAPGTPGVEPAVTAKPTEFLYLEQCRQPRRGGTGGDGTIRRTRRRRLRWSSPPGQIEQVPRVACLLCRLPTTPLACFPAPYPPSPFPGGEGGDSKFISPGAPPPGTPALNHLRHLQNSPSKCPAEESLLGIADCPRRRPRRGGRGQGSKPKAWSAGGKEGKLPPP